MLKEGLFGGEGTIVGTIIGAVTIVTVLMDHLRRGASL
jgi:predicted ABC-type sugar transport system permease subunit